MGLGSHSTDVILLPIGCDFNTPTQTIGELACSHSQSFDEFVMTIPRQWLGEHIGYQVLSVHGYD